MHQSPQDTIQRNISVFFQLLLEKIIIGVADYIFKEVLLLYLDRFQSELLFAKIIKILVHRLNTQIYGFRLKELHQIPLVGKEIFLADAVVVVVIKLNCP